MDANGKRIMGVQRWDAIVQSLPLYCIERRRFSTRFWASQLTAHFMAVWLRKT
jgi:hypothetical protein